MSIIICVEDCERCHRWLLAIAKAACALCWPVAEGEE